MTIIDGMDNGILLIFSLIAFTLFYVFYNILKFFYNKVFGRGRTVYNIENDQEEDVDGEVECAICMSITFKNKVELVCSHNYCGIL